MTHEGSPRTIYALHDLLDVACSQRPRHVALVDGMQRIGYEELTSRVSRFAKLLHTSGVNRGDRVAIFLPRSIESVIALFGTWYAGAVAVVINDVLKARQVNYILEHAEASLLVSDTRLFSSVQRPAVPSDQTILVDRLTMPEEGINSCTSIGVDLALIVYTSGSTGMPKGIMLSHENLIAGAYITADYLHVSDTDVLISLLPFSFDYGLNQLLTAILVKGTLVIERSVFAADICGTLVREKVTGMAAVPMLWQQLANPRSPFVKRAFPSLRYITNTGGRMPESIVKLFRTIHPYIRIYLMFGLTEAFRSTFLPPDEVDRRPTSIGKAIPNCEILLLNEDGKPCAPGEVGELVHRGATVSMGYWRDPEATAIRFRPAPFQHGRGGLQDIAVYSGDYARMDDDGYIYFIGRKDQMIKSHGMRVSPEEIEECVFASGMVMHAVAFGVPKDEVDNNIVVAVIPVDRSSFSEHKLVDFAGKEMPEYMRPDIIWSLAEFPQTSSGKPDRVRIKEMFVERHQ